MKLLVWDIQKGGGKRWPRIEEEIAAHDPDVIALTEFRANTPMTLRDRGWPHVETSGPVDEENGIAVFSATPLRAVARNYRRLEVELPAYGFGMSVLQIMAATTPAKTAEKKAFWDSAIEASAARMAMPYVLAGSWNTGAHGIDEKGKTFKCTEQFSALSAMGWTDAWRHLHPGTREWSWYSTQGNGFRVDHMFASPGLLPRVVSCRYSHTERVAKVSDHSLMIMEIEPPG